VTSHKILSRVEDTSALAITGRERLTGLADMLGNIHRQGRPLSDYNLRVATEDIADTVNILWRLQDELCKFKGNKT
jgi:hypothetical protein